VSAACYMRSKIDYGSSHRITGEALSLVWKVNPAIGAGAGSPARLYRNRLSLSVEHQRLVKDDDQRGHRDTARQTAGRSYRPVVAGGNGLPGPVFFAMNSMDTPHLAGRPSAR